MLFIDGISSWFPSLALVLAIGLLFVTRGGRRATPLAVHAFETCAHCDDHWDVAGDTTASVNTALTALRQAHEGRWHPASRAVDAAAVAQSINDRIARQ